MTMTLGLTTIASLIALIIALLLMTDARAADVVCGNFKTIKAFLQDHKQMNEQWVGHEDRRIDFYIFANTATGEWVTIVHNPVNGHACFGGHGSSNEFTIGDPT